MYSQSHLSDPDVAWAKVPFESSTYDWTMPFDSFKVASPAIERTGTVSLPSLAPHLSQRRPPTTRALPDPSQQRGCKLTTVGRIHLCTFLLFHHGFRTFGPFHSEGMPLI